jgi:GGDEF domain-containing protein
MAARVVLESELADTKTDLADVRDDLSRSQTKEEETRKSALHDALTGLPNRVLFEQSLDNGLNQAKRHGPPVLGKMSPLLFLICVLIMGARRNIHYGHEIF